MKKSEVLDLIESCHPHREMFECVDVPAAQSISDLTYLAAYNMHDNIKQAILLATEDSEAGEWERLGENTTVCSKCGKGLQDDHGYRFVLNEFEYCPFCGRAMKVKNYERRENKK